MTWRLLLPAALLAGCTALGESTVPYEIAGDAIPAPLTAAPGDAQRGREVVAGREASCLLCHAVPDMRDRYMGNVGPPLGGIGARLTPGQLRLRIADPGRLNRDAIMPSYFKTQGLNRVAEPYKGQPILSAQQIEDVVAYLATLR